MDENKIHSILKKYREENKKAVQEVQASVEELKVSLAATVSHFNKAMERMESANDEFASEISEHIVDLDVRVSMLEKKDKS